jgi:hypothetical protein
MAEAATSYAFPLGHGQSYILAFYVTNQRLATRASTEYVLVLTFNEDGPVMQRGDWFKYMEWLETVEGGVEHKDAWRDGAAQFPKLDYVAQNPTEYGKTPKMTGGPSFFATVAPRSWFRDLTPEQIALLKPSTRRCESWQCDSVSKP